jgi:hypothetical protein
MSDSDDDMPIAALAKMASSGCVCLALCVCACRCDAPVLTIIPTHPHHRNGGAPAMRGIGGADKKKT